MVAAVILSMPERPDVEKLTVYYRNSMMTDIMKWFCRMSGKKKFTMQDMDNMERTAAFRAADRTPLFLEYGLPAVPGWKWLRGSIYEVRYLYSDAGVGTF